MTKRWSNDEIIRLRQRKIMSKIKTIFGTVYVGEQLFLPAMPDTECEIEQNDIKREVVPLTPDGRFKGGYRTFQLTVEAPVYVKRTYILSAKEVEIT